jgi:hypothetical protein
MRKREPDVRPSGPETKPSAQIVPHPAREEYVVTLRALPAPVEGIVRVRRVLKLALRAFGLRCVSIRREEMS